MATQKERFLKYLQTCVKSTRSTDTNPLFLAGNAPKDYVRFLEPDRLFDYNPSKWKSKGSLYDITDYDEAKEIFDELISDDDFRERDRNDNSGWRKGAISHYVCFLSAEKFFSESPSKLREDVDHDKTPAILSELPLQQIFYGAPGTGKSHSVEEVCKEYTHFRTTFHPDSDYSTFVGCYKPVTIKKEEECYGVQKLREMYNEFHTKYPSHNISRFVGLHYKSFLQLTNDEAFAVFKDFSADNTILNILSNAIPQAEACGELMKGCDSKISYAFTPQAFTLAYIEAWRDLSKPVFLVIEEINRGNCAQIFGDLFQLLDRNEDGYSSYEIVPDTDLKNYIAAQGLKIEDVGNNNDEDISEKLMSGELMALPPNLHIWATMNTSDQSLFPIDSAFKRRWDWKYVPINTEAKSGWKIAVDSKDYSWASFLEKINDEIDTTTSSEDKQLGFFFCKADDTDEDDNNGTISAEKFVGKVLFYIYNDVFKDYGLDQEFFKDKENAGKKISFRSLFKMNGDINEGQVAKILDNLGVEIYDANTDAIADEDNTEADDSDDSNDKIKLTIKFPDGEVVAENTKFDSYLAALKKIGLDKTEEIASKKKYHRLGCALISKNQESVIIDAANYSYVEEQGFYIIKGANGKTMRNMLNLLSRELDLNLEVGYE